MQGQTHWKWYMAEINEAYKHDRFEGFGWIVEKKKRKKKKKKAK